MATRFYLPSSGSTEISPTVSTAFDNNAGTFFRAPLAREKTNTAFRTDSQNVAYFEEDCYAQFISPALKTQTLAANSDVAWSIRVAAETQDGTYEAVIRVIGSDGTTVRGTFYADENLGTQWPNLSNHASRYVSVTTGTTGISIQRGDFLVFEIGMYNSFEAPTPEEEAPKTGEIRFGDSGADDLTASNGDTGANDNPWIEFEHDFKFIEDEYEPILLNSKSTLGHGINL